ncbi:DUF456 domain-containing protein [Mycolicibacterium aichiense]|uniref:Membrane protein n=1 Tax=Mycolicibacterium aichiense TaxID=1799 RepID=A0AAD1MFY1_9MYCO|nr:DUF456 domain-containing protein [Mycolicibacterium aichiense]MCV7016924.1 DUF456 family protein [Mycolicibacterium aichiense]BBX10654.1 membrane protein [Mycolicibacterium aichiense]STZ25689.1 Protein of uncharacterised function (DUF456) [Mycolicibacterium aichiense]
MSTGGIVLVGLAIAIGLVGVIVPLLPGTLLIYAAIAVWAVVEGSLVSWVVLGVVTAVLGATLLIKYLLPARRMRAGEVGTWTLGAGAVLGIIGFFVVPVIGLLFGFVLGVYLAELAARRDQRRAWAATVLALKAAALSVGVELSGGLIATGVWVAGLLLTQ